MREHHQTLYWLWNMLLAWRRREFGMLQGMLRGMHQRIGFSSSPDRRHPLAGSCMARGSFKLEADKYKAYGMHFSSNYDNLPDSLEGLRAFKRLVEKLA